MFKLLKSVSVAGVILVSSSVLAQPNQPTNDFLTEIELGAIFTSGNTEDENIKYKVTFDWLRGNWEHQFVTEGFRSSTEDELSAQRLYHVGSTQYNVNETSYWLGRLAYEDDRFSGYDYQADATMSYGRNFLQTVDNMALSTEIGAGVRKSESELEDFTEAIIRAAGTYEWSVSETANFVQTLSVEAGDESTIFRSESGIESEIMENLSLRFSVSVKHQTEVPIGREKTDTVTAVTLVWNF